MAPKLTLKEIDAEIAKLQQQANQIRESEKADVIARMKEAIAYYAITATDLGLGADGRKGRKARGTAQKGAKSNAGRIKYRDDAGHTWSGHGRRPQWFLDALSSGKTEEELRAA